MLSRVKFSEAFLFEPSYLSSFLLRGTVYQYRGQIIDDGRVVVVATYVGKKGLAYRALPDSVYSNDYVTFF